MFRFRFLIALLVGATAMACNLSLAAVPPTPTVVPSLIVVQAATSTPIPTLPAVAHPTYVVQRGDVQNILEFSGRWQPRDQTQLSFPIAGTIRTVAVKRGDAVRVGQLLADYQIDQLENQLQTANLQLTTAKENLTSGTTGSLSSVANAQVQLANADLNLQKAQDSSPWPQVESAKIQLDVAQQNLVNAQHSYDDAISRPTNPQSAIDSAYNGLQSAQNSLRSAQASYDSSAQSYADYKYTIQSAQNGVIAAQLGLIQAQTSGADPSKQQAVDSAQLNVDQIQEQIDQSTLRAPADAEVLDVSIKPGDAVKAYDIVITVGQPEPREAVASIAIGDAQKLAVGMIGVCEVLNRPETAVQCVVRRIPSSAKDPDQTTRVAASLEDLNLATDTLIDVQMPIQISKNVLWLPPAAIRTFQNRTFVVIQTANGPRSPDVVVGLKTTDRVEIKSGVNEGDIVEGP